MAGITSLNFVELLTNTTSEIFETMLSMEIDITDIKTDIVKDKNRIVGSVGFAGEVTGCMNIHVGDAFAKIIAGAMLGEDPETLATEDVLDAVGELSNMIGGDIKSRLCDEGMSCSLSIPTTLSGGDFTIESHGWMVHKSINFSSNENAACVEVYVKSNNSI